MLYLESSLEVMGQADLLQWLALSRQTGVCNFSQHHNSRKLYFSDGRIIACESNEPYLLLGQFLISSGRIDPEVLRKAMMTQECTGVSLGQILIESGSITEAELQRLVVAKAEETVHGLSEWKHAFFRFVPDLEPPRDAMRVELSVQQVLLEGARRVDEMEQALSTLGSEHSLLHKTDRVVDDSTVANFMARRLYDSIDGQRSADDLILQCRTSRYPALTFLARLVERGHVRVGEMRALRPGPGTRDLPDVVLSELQQLVANEYYSAALDLVERQERPQRHNNLLSMLIAKAEAGFVAKAYRNQTPPEAVPHLVGQNAADMVVRSELTPDEAFLLELVDGSWDVRSLVWISPLRKVDVVRGLSKLLDLGHIELRSPQERDTSHQGVEHTVDDVVQDMFPNRAVGST